MNFSQLPQKICIIAEACLLVSFFAGCTSGSGGSPKNSSGTFVPQVSPTRLVNFIANAPADTDLTQPIYLNIVDDLTGLDYLSDRYRMTAEADHTFSIQLAFPIHSLIKYRYSTGSDQQTYEMNSHNEPVNFRLYSVSGDGEIHDSIYRWTVLEDPDSITTGDISGTLDLTHLSRSVLYTFQVCAGGICTSTAPDGSYFLSGLQPGIHHLVVYSPQGSIPPIQQDVTINPNSTSEVKLSFPSVQWVDVTFSVSQPEEFSTDLSLRMVGNISPLGYVNYDSSLSTSIYPRRAPSLMKISDTEYGITLRLPVGFDLKYKYTYGDGFWNSELDQNGDLMTRELIVPDQSIVIHDQIALWKPVTAEAIQFSVTIPENIPPTDEISIQFNVFGWKTPLPMVRSGENSWTYTLYNPVLANSAFSYRYCRNDQCAALAETSAESDRKIVSTQHHQDTIPAWNWWTPEPMPQTVVIPEINQQEAGFLRGVQITTNNLQLDQTFFPRSLADLSQNGFTDVIFCPKWNILPGNTPSLEPDEREPLEDQVTLANLIHSDQMNLIYYPSIKFPDKPDPWWEAQQRDSAWWQNWFSEYTRFVEYNADFSQTSGASALILGGEFILPALPNGTLADGSASGVPVDAADRWNQMIEGIRNRYHGKIYWGVNYAAGLDKIPDFVTKLDGIYLQINYSPLGSSSSLPINRILTFSDDLEDPISALHDRYSEEIIFSFGIPSTKTNAMTPDNTGEILSIQAGADSPLTGAWTDQKIQLDGYNEILTALNNYPWVGGVVCADTYLPAKAQDPTSSVHGKWVESLLSYWFSELK